MKKNLIILRQVDRTLTPLRRLRNVIARDTRNAGETLLLNLLLVAVILQNKSAGSQGTIFLDYAFVGKLCGKWHF